jgi:hypothetical protein
MLPWVDVAASCTGADELPQCTRFVRPETEKEEGKRLLHVASVPPGELLHRFAVFDLLGPDLLGSLLDARGLAGLFPFSELCHATPFLGPMPNMDMTLFDN